MIIGQTLVAAGAAQTFYTPWFPRQADNAVFTFEEIHNTLSGGAESLVIEARTKPAEDAGADGDLVDSFTQLTGTDLYEAEGSDMKELVRFKISINYTSGALHFRFLQPTWYATAKV